MLYTFASLADIDYHWKLSSALAFEKQVVIQDLD